MHLENLILYKVFSCKCSRCEAAQPDGFVLKILNETGLSFTYPLCIYSVCFPYTSFVYFTEQSNCSVTLKPT